jgi:malate synthase
MRAYTELLVSACHKRGAHAIGGMAAFIPNRRDMEVTERVMAKIREDKEREARDGFDGAWVAHPDLVPLVTEVFDAALGENPHQKNWLREDVQVKAAQLSQIAVPGGQITEAGLRLNINVALQYLNAWLQGNGAVAIHNLMEDTATAEISRAQLWQWRRHNAELADGRPVNRALYEQIRDQEMEQLLAEGNGRYQEAAGILDQLVLSDDFIEFLTIPAYGYLA